VERPLAKRRQLIESLAEKAEDDEQSTPVKGLTAASSANTPVKATTEGDDTPIRDTETFESAPVTPKQDANIDDPEVESIAELEDLNKKEKKSGILKALSPKKSLKEIEAEVAANTAKYDADTMKGEPISKTMKGSKDVPQAKRKSAVPVAVNVTPTNVTRLIRMFVIILLGSYKGEYFVPCMMCKQILEDRFLRGLMSLLNRSVVCFLSHRLQSGAGQHCEPRQSNDQCHGGPQRLGE